MGTHDCESLLARHKPSLIVLGSQISAAIVHGVVKSVETASTAKHAVDPFQILLVRMVITGVACSAYLWFKRVPDFPWGHRDVRHVLLLRALGGVLGAGGMYYSIRYLTLSQATALNFLAPMGAMVISKYMDQGAFSYVDRAGATVALAGVVMVVQPDNILTSGDSLAMMPSPRDTNAKIKGLIWGVFGVFGTMIALVTMRRMGSRAHPLTMVNYFAWVVVLAAVVLVSIQQLSWPTSVKTWGYMMIIGIFGGLTEFLLTAGIASDASPVATIMIYSQVLWALALDRVVWHISMNLWTLIGVGSVVGSLTLVSLAKEVPHFGRGRRAKQMLPQWRRQQTRFDAVPHGETDEVDVQVREQCGSLVMHEIAMDELYDEQDVYSA
ncbi:hypothetical protein BD289DRAFT_451670 [Coniella lustricola]|uniref:EamA domain-containing protein n=1 Tax=Coniella lustricola TaxID=2025994 RepID=A0A2T3AE00_9PEZI|nr:hypothetical protein BD289DRAFT_451670 [Coniella lustricola]